jgi:2-polyprenyl-3-methyl-5-hydroxy-6-metoxy-1,4-benzoquinol methylase
MPEPDRIAALYAPSSGYQSHRLNTERNRYRTWESRRDARLARLVGPPTSSGARLLDVGCATGTFLVRARAQGWQVRGIEPGEHMVAFARSTHGLDVELGGAEAAAGRFDSGSFDIITLWDVVEHLQHPLRVMRHLFDLLKPGGTLYLATPNEDGWLPRAHWHLLRPVLGIWPHPEPPRHLYQFSRKTIERLFESAGFEAVRVRHDEIPLWYTSGFVGVPGMKEWLQGEPRATLARSIYCMSAPVFLAARLARRGDSMIVSGSRPAVGLMHR